MSAARQLMRNERFSAVALILAAALGLALANSPWGPAIIGVRDLHLGPDWLPDLSVGHWVTDGLLAIFFLLAAVELKHELQHGELDSPKKAMVPVVAAIGGVIAPALIFLLLVRDSQLADGWPIPTATDIAFALGLLAIFGKGLPRGIRTLLLAIAVIDDLIAITLIAIFFTAQFDLIPLLIAVPVIVLFGLISRGGRSALRVPALIVLGVLAWYLVYRSGVHPTVAGVCLGLVLASERGRATRHAFEPVTNAFILPLFAFTAALVAFPSVGLLQLSPVFWAIVVALPVGKLVGITAGTLLAGGGRRMPLPDILAVAGLGGVGFTVSLLMNELAYRGRTDIAAQGTLGVLAASMIAVLIGGVLVVLRARRYGRDA